MYTTPQLVQLVKVLHRNSECGGSAGSNPAWGMYWNNTVIFVAHTIYATRRVNCTYKSFLYEDVFLGCQLTQRVA